MLIALTVLKKLTEYQAGTRWKSVVEKVFKDIGGNEDKTRVRGKI